MPVMDWFVVQIKHYSGLDAFPFVIMKGTDRVALLRDLSTTYSAVVDLDDQSIGTIPENILFIRHQVIAFMAKSSIIDAKATAGVLSYCFKKGMKGSPSCEELLLGI